MLPFAIVAIFALIEACSCTTTAYSLGIEPPCSGKPDVILDFERISWPTVLDETIVWQIKVFDDENVYYDEARASTFQDVANGYLFAKIFKLGWDDRIDEILRSFKQIMFELKIQTKGRVVGCSVLCKTVKKICISFQPKEL